MMIGVMSDTHDNLSNTLYVLNAFRERQISTIIHCGDLTSLEMVSHFGDFGSSTSSVTWTLSPVPSISAL